MRSGAHRRRNAFVAKAMLALWLLMTVFNVVHACALQAHDGVGAAAAVVAPHGDAGVDHDALVGSLCDAAEPALAKAQTPDSAIAPPPSPAKPRAAWWPEASGRVGAQAGSPPPPGASLVIRFLRLTI